VKRGEVARYFRILGKLFPHPAQVILTGAAAGALYGRIRSTRDINFALKLKARSTKTRNELWRIFSEAARETTLRTRIAVEYAEDIDRWSQITYLDYARYTRTFKKFGRLDVRLLEPPYWSIGKFARYLEPDIRDLVEVLKKTETSWKVLVPVLGRALKKSPKSTACFQFRRQVEDFLTGYGWRVWGRRYAPENALRLFRSHAGINVTR